MNKIKLALASVLVASIVALTGYFQPAFAQQAFMQLAAIFGTGPAGQVITSNASGLPIATVPGGGQTYNLGVEVKAGAGTTVADAAALSATQFTHQCTGANGTLGWKFAATTTANVCHLLLGTTAGVMKVYANTGGTCNGGATDAACTLTTGILPHFCCSTAADTWLCA